MKWSRRVDVDLAANRLTRTLHDLRAAGRPIIDLTLSNPTRAGLDYPPDLLAGLADARGLEYRPEPLGLASARSAVAADYARRRISVAADRVVLTASTSEAYSLLFKVLCDPGDEVLVPRPSYPLFEHLTRLDAVVARPYDLEYHGAWSIDCASIEHAWAPATRAVLIVSPNNPTGSFVTGRELEWIAARCRAGEAAIIADEVFADYAIDDGDAAAGHVLEREDVLAFGLGGLSKSIGLPQAKLAWMAAAGPPDVVEDAMVRLELAADTYLSVSTPVQAAAPDLLERGHVVRDQIRARITRNYRHLAGLDMGPSGCAVLRVEGGWSAVLRVPSVDSEETLAVTLLAHDGVLTHPGYFFDFAAEAYLVVSLLPAEHLFREGIARILRHFACKVGCP